MFCCNCGRSNDECKCGQRSRTPPKREQNTVPSVSSAVGANSLQGLPRQSPNSASREQRKAEIRANVIAELGEGAPAWAVNGQFLTQLSQEQRFNELTSRMDVQDSHIQNIANGQADLRRDFSALQGEVAVLRRSGSAGEGTEVNSRASSSLPGRGTRRHLYNDVSSLSIVCGGFERDTPKSEIEDLTKHIWEYIPAHLHQYFGPFFAKSKRCQTARAQGKPGATVNDIWAAVENFRAKEDEFEARYGKRLWITKAKTNTELNRGWKVADAEKALKEVIEEKQLKSRDGAPLTVEIKRPKGDGIGIVFISGVRVFCPSATSR